MLILFKGARRFKLFTNLFLMGGLQLLFCTAVPADYPEIISETRPLLHTFVEIKAYGEKAGAAIEEAFQEIERINALLNNYDPHSEISNINRHAAGDPVRITPETMEALELALKYSDLSGGAFDITIGPLLQLWGFAQEEAGISGQEPDSVAVREAMFLVDYHALELKKTKNSNKIIRTAKLVKRGMWIDVGAFSKGYAADRAIRLLKDRGIKNALIAAGGTICAIGKKPDASPWRVGIRHPRKTESFLTVVFPKDRTVSTSGDYERFYKKNDKKRTHIIDPRTGFPVAEMQSVTVIAKSGAESDALSTALFVLGPEEGIQLVNSLPDVEALLVSGAGKIFFSEGWPEKKIFY